jgi:hypothetical protein
MSTLLAGDIFSASHTQLTQHFIWPVGGAVPAAEQRQGSSPHAASDGQDFPQGVSVQDQSIGDGGMRVRAHRVHTTLPLLMQPMGGAESKTETATRRPVRGPVIP